MGTEETTNKKDNSFDFDELADVSDFYGLKSSSKNISYKEEEINSRKMKKDSDSKSSEYFSLIPTTFEWDGGGKSVYVTGDFCKWEQFFLMKKKSESKYILTINLPRGYHQYKFKIDGEWKYNNKYPTCNDDGNINNYLDTTNSDKTVKNSDEGATAISTNFTDNNIEISKIPKKVSKNLFKVNSELNQEQKKIQDMKKLDRKVPKIPIEYSNSMNINLKSNQNKLGAKNFLKINENNILSDNLSFKTLISTPSEQINHLESKNNKNKSVVVAVSSRYKFKFITFVYYKPKYD